MLNKNIIIFLIIILIVSMAGIFFWQLKLKKQSTPSQTLLPSLPPPIKEELMTLTGILKFTEIEGGCYFLETPEGEKYELLDNKENLKKFLGQEITLKGNIRDDMFSICMLGSIFEVREIATP